MQILKNIKKAVKQFSQWKQLIQQIRPSIDFEEATLPPAPNYESLSSWAAHPKKTSKAHYTPASIPTSDNWKNGQVDCFFIPPTVYFSPSAWNLSLIHI